MMKFLILLLVSFFMRHAIGQEEMLYQDRDIIQMFKLINKSDKSNRNDTTVRHKSFIENFNIIVNLIETQGFINTANLRKKDGEIISRGVTRTLTHIFQIQPNLILNDHFIDLITIELNEGRFRQEYLLIPLSVYVYDNKIKIPYNEMLNKAITKWGIKEQEIIK